MYENQIAAMIEQLEDQRVRSGRAENQSDALKALLRDHEDSMKVSCFFFWLLNYNIATMLLVSLPTNVRGSNLIQ